MITRMELTQDLYQETVDQIRKDGKNWGQFLQSACRNYRLPFTEMVLVYAQKPEAMAVLEMEQWNRRYGLWIQKGAKGIAVIDEDYTNRTRLKFYFDYSDTRPGKVKSVKPPIWDVPSHRYDNVKEHLNKTYGVEGSTLAGTILKCSRILTEQNKDSLLNDMQFAKTDSKLSVLSEEELDSMMTDLLFNSVAFSALSRCGIYAFDYVEAESLDSIQWLDTSVTFKAFGVNWQNTTQTLIREIHKEVMTQQKNRTLESQPRNVHNEDEERSGSYENRIQTTRGRPASQSDIETGKRGSTWEIRIDEKTVSEGAPELSVSGVSDESDPESTFDGDRTDSSETERTADEPAQNKGQDHRTAQERGSDPVGTEDVSNREGDRRDPQNRTDLSVETKEETIQAGDDPAFFAEPPIKPVPSLKDQQLSLFDMEWNDTELDQPEPPDLSVPQQFVDTALRSIPLEPEKRWEIADQTALQRSLEENSTFIQHACSHGTLGLLIGRQQVAVSWDERGVTIGCGKSTRTATIQSVLSWEQAAETIERLVQEGRYLPQTELDKIEDHRYQRLSENLWYMVQDLDLQKDESYLEILRNDYLQGFPEGTKKIHMQLRLPDLRARIIQELEDCVDLIQREPERLRYRHRSPQKILAEVNDLTAYREPLKTFEEPTPADDYFVTQDQIDATILHSYHEHQKIQTYSFFCNHTDKKERIHFLKDAWGWSGSNDHDSDGKGLKIYSRSLHHPYASVFLAWTEVEKRLDTLFKQDRFLSEQEKSHLKDYERSVLAQNIHSYFYRLDFSQLRPYRFGKGDFEISDIQDLLKWPETLHHVIDLVALSRPQDKKNQKVKNDLLSDLLSYDRGTYTQFHVQRQPQKEPYVPCPDLEESIVSLLIPFYREVDPYDFQDSFSNLDGEEIREQFVAGLRDIGALQDTIKELNQTIKEGEDSKWITMAEVLREDLAYLYARGQGSNLTIGSEIQMSYRSEVLTELSHYREGDFVFIEYDRKPLYGTIELVDADRVYVESYPSISDVNTQIEIDRNEFERCLRQDARNSYVFDPNRAPVQDPERIQKENYQKLQKIAPEILTKDADILHFNGGSHRYPVTIERIDEDRIAISSYYEQNGDSMADPDMEFVIDTNAHRLSARIYQQDNLGIYQEVEMENDLVLDPELEEELNTFAGQWLDTIQRDYTREEPIQSKEDQMLSPFERIKGPELKEDSLEDKAAATRDVAKSEFKTAREKCADNLQAIRILRSLEEEKRPAREEEKDQLRLYTGWGALADVFDPSKENWETERNELQTLLSPEEYQSAMESTLTAFYTPSVLIDAIYSKLRDFGVSAGNVLEPSCGIGNFFARKPVDMDLQFYGVEIDPLSGKMAQALYPEADIQIKGYEEAALPDDSFDVAIGNVPFGDYQVQDSKYDRYHFLIHDFFFAKTIDKLRPGGILAFITSTGTMDKADNRLREHLAQYCDLLGGVRLPNDTFSKEAGTTVNSDLLFFQKRHSIREKEELPDWVDTEKQIEFYENKEGERQAFTVQTNRYFIEHPEMILAEPKNVSGPFGPQRIYVPKKDTDLRTLLDTALTSIQLSEERDTESVDIHTPSLDVDLELRNFSYCIQNGSIYYKENESLNEIHRPKSQEERIRALIPLRDTLRELIELQVQDADESSIRSKQQELNQRYDAYQKQYGLLHSRATRQAFEDDSSYSLLCSLEIIKEDGSLERKSDIFTKRTIRPNKPVDHVESPEEAVILSVSEKGKIDFVYMEALTGMDKDNLVQQLQGVIYPDPAQREENGEPVYETADAYLSGDIRQKLALARQEADQDERYRFNVEDLEKVLPEPIKAGDISVRLGTTWIPPEIYREFIFDLLQTPRWQQYNIKVYYTATTEEWYISGKSSDQRIETNRTFGTHRINAYKIIENMLNLRNVKIFDKTYDEEGKEIRVLNKKETAIAQGKQDLIKARFSEWIWKDPIRREKLTDLYNEKFNSIRNRTYDGSHLRFAGMNPMITLRKHQRDAIARILYGGNTLLAHTVGAGKTFEMIAAGMESKRLGLCTKPMYAVPNNIINDFASDFYTLYPAAHILVATNRDLSKENRRKFFGRIASGEWDGIIVTHSQFSRIPISPDRQRQMIEDQIQDITESIRQLKENHGERYTIKQMMLAQKKLRDRLKKLNDSTRKDDLIYFEELGIDQLFVDEADLFKNLFLYSKMRNVSGISQTDSQRASDLHMKTQYLNEKTKNRGVIFATGTPVSNSMAELYTMQRYLQPDTLKRYGLESFDAWASTFGETVTAMELSPDGKGFQFKTRFSKFYNLPELMTLFREVADIQTADMINLPVPNAHYEVISVEGSQAQKDMVDGLAKRSEKIHNREVDPQTDNMLKVTSDGRKLALDQRLMNPLLPDDPHSKVNACVENIYRIWKDNKEQKLTQILFCDLSTPTQDGFNVYDDVRKKLIEKGVPPDEVQHVHIAKNEKQKQDLFAKVRAGDVRIINGSTSKMGAGTNVQDKLIAIHDLDCPWRPRDLEQRRGRIVRQGNQNEDVYIYRYITKGTFDSYLYQTIEKKQTFISQVFTSKTPQRTMEEVDETVLNYAEIKAIACGDERIMERCNLEVEVNRLQTLKSSYLNQKYELQDRIVKYYPHAIQKQAQRIDHLEKDIQRRNQFPVSEEFSGMKIQGRMVMDKAEAGKQLLETGRSIMSSKPVKIGEYRGFDLYCSFDSFMIEYKLSLTGAENHTITLGNDKFGNITRLNNALSNMDKELEEAKIELQTLKRQFEIAKEEVDKPFEQEESLQQKEKRLHQLTMELRLDSREDDVLDTEEQEEPEKESRKELCR